MIEVTTAFGARLRAAREAKGYTLRKFAQLTGISPTYLSQVEQGKVDRPPTAERIRRMAGFLGEDVDEWCALAGRVPEEIEDILIDNPKLFELVRAAKNMTPDQIDGVTDIIKLFWGEK